MSKIHGGGSRGEHEVGSAAVQRSPGKRTLTERLPVQAKAKAGAVVQRKMATVKTLERVFWSQPPMTEDQGRTFMRHHAEQQVDAAEAFLAALETTDQARPRGEEIFKIEWGLARDVEGSGECVLIRGKGTEVDAKPYEAHVVMIAHCHPHLDVKSATGVTPKEQKERGARDFYDFSFVDDMVLGMKARQVLMPSPDDVSYCFHQGVTSHEVFTPYYLAQLSGTAAGSINQQNTAATKDANVGRPRFQQFSNPRVAAGKDYLFDTGGRQADQAHQETPQDPSTQFLRFVITKPQQLQGENVYRCDLAMYANDVLLREWPRKQVNAAVGGTSQALNVGPDARRKGEWIDPGKVDGVARANASGDATTQQ